MLAQNSHERVFPARAGLRPSNATVARLLERLAGLRLADQAVNGCA